jgi:hypothetical protein
MKTQDKEFDVAFLEGSLALAESSQDNFKEMLSDWRWMLTHPFSGFAVLRSFLQGKAHHFSYQTQA